MTRLIRIVAVLGLVAVVVRARPQLRRGCAHGWRTLQRRERFLVGKARGWAYHLRGGHPDPDVVDAVLADRVRSALGLLEKRLGARPLDVRVDDHVVFLHGEVADYDDAAALERAVQDMSGVAAVRSHLRVVTV
jgi:hypothetical protein